MIKTEFKTRVYNDLESIRKKSSKSIRERSKSNKKDGSTNRANASSMSRDMLGHQKAEGFKAHKIGSLRKTMMKQNKPLNQNTPKNLKICRGEPIADDALQMQSIKFISKECSSIKENHNDDYISFSNSANNLDQFSPLFDRTQKENSSKEEFTLQICGIQDSEQYFQFTNGKDLSFSGTISMKQENSSSKTGRIKKNNIKTTMSNEKQNRNEIERQVIQIFNTLDHSKIRILNRKNCSSQKLTTQLNYLIGTILTKIKVKGQQYDFGSFEEEFKSLIESSEREEILEILQNNRNKRIKLQRAPDSEASMENTQNNIIVEESVRLKTQEQRQMLSPQFKKIKIQEGVSQKLNKISNKLNNYLIKNNLQALLHQVQEKPINHIEQKQNQYIRQLQKEHINQRSRHHIQIINPHEDQRMKSSKSTERCTISTCNSNVSFNNTESFHKSYVGQKHNIQVIKKTDGSAFELNFTELNKFLD